MFIDSAKGGMQGIVLDLVLGLNNLGWECILIGYKDCELVKLFIHNNIKVFEVKKPASILQLLAFISEYYKYIRKSNSRFIITNDIFTHIITGIYPLKKNEIFVSHGGDYKSRGKEYASKTGISAIIAKMFSFRRVKTFIAVSDSQKKFLIENAHIPSKKINVIYNGINCSKIIPNENTFTNKTIRISVIGYIKRLKNQGVLLKSIKYLNDNGYHCVLNLWGAVADNDYYNELCSEISSLSLDKLISFKGYTKDKNYIYQNSDIVISCSYQEGFGLSLIEAMAYKVPTISYAKSAGPASIISNLKNGILVEENTPEEYAKAIEIYITNYKLRNDIIKSGYSSVQNRFSSDIMVQQYNELLKHECNSQSRTK